MVWSWFTSDSSQDTLETHFWLPAQAVGLPCSVRLVGQVVAELRGVRLASLRCPAAYFLKLSACCVSSFDFVDLLLNLRHFIRVLAFQPLWSVWRRLWRDVDSRLLFDSSCKFVYVRRHDNHCLTTFNGLRFFRGWRQFRDHQTRIVT